MRNTELEEIYGEGVEITVDKVYVDGENYSGIMYGNSDCYDGDYSRFYQFLLTDDGKLLKMFYEPLDPNDPGQDPYTIFEDIDYKNDCYDVEDVTDEYEDELGDYYIQ